MTHLDIAIKILHSDRGGEYLDKGFILYLKSRGTEQKLTMHDMPAHNGVTECCNCTIVECVCVFYSMLADCQKFLLGEATHHVV